jgi:hypothetical protein
MIFVSGTLFLRSIKCQNILMSSTRKHDNLLQYSRPFFCSFIVHNINRNTLHCVHDDNDKLNATQLVAHPTLIYFPSAKKHYCVILQLFFPFSPTLILDKLMVCLVNGVFINFHADKFRSKAAVAEDPRSKVFFA